MAPNKSTIYRLWPSAGSSREQVENALRNLDQQMQQLNSAVATAPTPTRVTQSDLNKEQILFSVGNDFNSDRNASLDKPIFVTKPEQNTQTNRSLIEINQNKAYSRINTSYTLSGLINKNLMNQTGQVLSTTLLPLLLSNAKTKGNVASSGNQINTNALSDEESDDQVFKTVAKKSHLPYLMLILVLLLMAALFVFLFFKCLTRYFRRVWKSDKTRVPGLSMGGKLDLKTAQLLGQAYKEKVLLVYI